VVGEPGEQKPLILDQKGRLYLYRYWEYQEELARGIKSRIRDESDVSQAKPLQKALNRVFPDAGEAGIDWQKVAAFAAARRKFCVITGGPGTGKTTTVAKILALLIEQHKDGTFRPALVSPTGKGASRLQEAMRKAKETLACEERVKALIPDSASTIHRLLGRSGVLPTFDSTPKIISPSMPLWWMKPPWWIWLSCPSSYKPFRHRRDSSFSATGTSFPRWRQGRCSVISATRDNPTHFQRLFVPRSRKSQGMRSRGSTPRPE
jgi:energy-coupling factor transporter ATP-binding protein EcfA2